jgi:hypothetical protein
MRRRPKRPRLRRSEIDYLLLEVFGPRYLPDAVAIRIALRAELARGLADAFDRRPDLLGPAEAATVEAVAV